MSRAGHRGKARNVIPAKFGWSNNWSPPGPVIITKSARKCPHCKCSLIIKVGKYGKFYGCQNYPECKYTQKIVEEKQQSISEKNEDRKIYRLLEKKENLLRVKLQEENINEEISSNIEGQLEDIKNKKEELCRKYGVKVPASNPILSNINPSYDRFHKWVKK